MPHTLYWWMGVYRIHGRWAEAYQMQCTAGGGVRQIQCSCKNPWGLILSLSIAVPIFSLIFPTCHEKLWLTLSSWLLFWIKLKFQCTTLLSTIHVLHDVHPVYSKVIMHLFLLQIWLADWLLENNPNKPKVRQIVVQEPN